MSVPDVLPPSPPTTNHRDRIYIPMAFKPSMSTPDDSPASFIPSSSAGNRKRVEFSPWPNVADPLSSTPIAEMAILKALPPSRECQKNSKSILKPYNGADVSLKSYDGTSEAQVACPEMLEAIAQQLSNNNKGSSLDAYQTLSQIIKAYDEVPEDVNTRSCIATILRCIKRDLSIPDQTHSSPIDTSLMTQALKVSVILVWSEHLSPLLTDEFRVFIIDRSINAVAEHVAPKVILIHYMHLLAMQNFRSGIMSSNSRAVKLLEALQDITNHIQGKGAISERLLIYHKLIEQAKPIMKARASLWVREVFLGLASSVKDIRDKAISVSTRACAAFPSSPTISAASREALASIISDKTGNDRTVNAILTQRLEKMVAAKDEAIQVPQIWALGMLFCNNNDARLDNWNLLRDWLRVIQRCFNCSDTTVRSQTFPAWNRFIHIAKPHEASDNVVSILAKPIIVQIERTSSNTTGKGLRPAALSSYCMLLYHAFRPAASHRQYTRMWNEYIVKIMGSQFLSKTPANADLCSRVVLSLMWKDSTSSRIWNENRAHENSFMEPEELPPIDCKWIRSKTEAILQLFRVMFKHSVWGPAVQYSDQAYVAKAWRHFVKAICESASKEIKPSTETRKALSHIIQFIQETPIDDHTNLKADILQGRNQLITSIAVAELGSMLFLEAMENDSDLQSPMLLEELLKVALNRQVTPSQNVSPIEARKQPVLAHSLQKSVKLLDHNLRIACEKNDLVSSPYLCDWISVTFTTLNLVPNDIVAPYLSLIQQGLALVITLNPNMNSMIGLEAFEEQRSKLMRAISKKIPMLASFELQRLDDLLVALLSSHKTDAQIELLQAWNVETDCSSKQSYGPKVMAAIELINRAGANRRPEAQTTIYEPATPVRGNAIGNTKVNNVPLTAPTDQLISPVGNVLVDGNEDDGNEDDGNEDDGNEDDGNEDDGIKQHPRNPSPSDKGLHRPHHNDSQYFFEPVDTSPHRPDEIESQFLTDRQKEVRDRQRMEPVVTFSDIRSSPRPLSNRGSRAPSVDCDIARKAAAIQYLPSTPNINRQQDAMDEDELPTPTPKARHRAIDMVGVDIPSSPPSVIGNRRINVDNIDLPSSPPKPQNETEIGMVDLSDENLLTGHPVGEPDEVHQLMQEEVDVGIATASCAQKPLGNGEVHAAQNVETAAHNESNLGSVVMETAQDMNTSCSRSGIQADTPHADIHSDEEIDTDEIDELSASQLSQSLETYIAEEARQNRAAAEQQHSKSTSYKRKKRTMSGYADQDRKKRRKRTSLRTEASHSSVVSDECNPTDEERVLEELIVSTSPIIATSKHCTPVAKGMVDAVSKTLTRSPTRSRLHQDGHGERLPLHFRSTNSKKTDDGVTPTTPSQGDSSRASTQVLDESIYESIARFSAITNPNRDDEKPESDIASSNNVKHHDNKTTKIVHPGLNSDAHTIGIMTALQSALKSLTNMSEEDQAKLDLKAIDDLCFNIRYQAQELTKGRK